MTAIVKPAYDENRNILADVLPLNTPYTIQIEVSSACNFKCKYCVHGLSHAELKKMGFKIKNMNWNTFYITIEQLKEFDKKVKIIYFVKFGESLLNKQLPEMIAHAKKENVAEKLGLVTNASLLTPDLSDKLIQSGLDVIRISLQGMTSSKYHEVCNVNLNFDNLVNNVRYLYENKKQCEIFVKIADIALETGEEESFYQRFQDISDRIFIERIRPLVKGINYSEMGVDESDSSTMFGYKHTPQSVCSMPFFQLHITSNGDIFPCCHYLDPTHFGNVETTTLKQVWDSEKRNLFLKMMLRKEREKQNDYPLCKKCEIQDINLRKEDELDDYADKVLLKLNLYDNSQV